MVTLNPFHHLSAFEIKEGMLGKMDDKTPPLSARLIADAG